jgi:hypothetical protein
MSTALMYSPYGATEDLKPSSFNWGNALGVGALGLVGYAMTKGAPGQSPSFPAYRKNPYGGFMIPAMISRLRLWNV